MTDGNLYNRYRHCPNCSAEVKPELRTQEVWDFTMTNIVIKCPECKGGTRHVYLNSTLVWSTQWLIKGE